jgi:hypothetical protein
MALVQDVIEGHAPDNFIGGSINAIGRAAKGKAPDGREGLIIESIEAANSVDDVTSPAAGGKFERLHAGVDDMTAALLNALTYEEFMESRPDLVDKLKTQLKRVRRDDVIRALEDERDTLKAQIATLETQTDPDPPEEPRDETARLQMTLRLEKVLREARLPQHWENTLRTLVEKLDVSEWAATIQTFSALARDVKPPPIPVVGAGRDVQQSVPVREAFNPVPGGDENYDEWSARMDALGL